MQDVAVSREGLELLTRVLVADPAQRMGMDEIKVNQWFLAGLPPGALEMNDHLISSCSMLDEVRGRPGGCQLVAPSCDLLAGLLLGVLQMHDHVIGSSMLQQEVGGSR